MWLGSGGESVTRRPRLETNLSGSIALVRQAMDAVYCAVQLEQSECRLIFFFVHPAGRKGDQAA